MTPDAVVFRIQTDSEPAIRKLVLENGATGMWSISTAPIRINGTGVGDPFSTIAVAYSPYHHLVRRSGPERRLATSRGMPAQRQMI